MQKKVVFAGCFLCVFLLFPFRVFGAELTVFGPRGFVLEGHRLKERLVFGVDEAGDGVLIVRDISQDAAARGVVKLKGKKRARVKLKRAFRGGEGVCEVPVKLKAQNVLKVKLRGKVGSGVEVEVRRTGLSEPEVELEASPDEIVYGEASTLRWKVVHAGGCTLEPGIGPVGPEGTVEVSPEKSTRYVLSCESIFGRVEAEARLWVRADVEGQPEGSFGKRYEDLIPSDSKRGRYEAGRFSVVTGLVVDTAGEGLEDVSVRVLGHPDYGRAWTDESGRYSTVVEGGGALTMVYEKAGFLTVHRRQAVGWNELSEVERVVMTRPDAASTQVVFDGDPGTVVRHRSTEVSDGFGSRHATLVFRGDNRAYETGDEGDRVRELLSLRVRATEYATESSMPARLPANSAYTYCVELGVDGARGVEFLKPVVLFVENFLGFEVGERVPVGRYDRALGQWIPMRNGRVVRLLDTDGDGRVDALDADGDGLGDDLTGDGTFWDEVRGIEGYAVGASYWRVEVQHFSPFDCNWPYGPPADAVPPNPPAAPVVDRQEVSGRDCRRELGSWVWERGRVFSERLGIAGSPLGLYYTSSRTSGFGHEITVFASGDWVPSSLREILVEVRLGGRVMKERLDAAANQRVVFSWDGRDYLGRPMEGPVRGSARVGFVYDAVLGRAAWYGRSFGQPPLEWSELRARKKIILWRHWDFTVDCVFGTLAEGWTISAHHQLSPYAPTRLYRGDGTVVERQRGIIELFAGSGGYDTHGDGVPATEAAMADPMGMVFDAPGNLYYAQGRGPWVCMVDREGINRRVAGTAWGHDGDGGPALEAKLRSSSDVAVDAQGNLYFSETTAHCIRKVDTEGIITTVAGTGRVSDPQLNYGDFCGDGGPAVEACLDRPNGLALDRAGNLYVADTCNHRIRKIDPAGIITTVAGHGERAKYYHCEGLYGGTGGPAIKAQLSAPRDVAVDSQGNLYIADTGNHCVRMVDTSGVVHDVAGICGYWYPAPDYGGDGGLATETPLNAFGIALDAQGSLYIADDYNHRVLKVNAEGIITTVAGDGTYGYSGNGGPARRAKLGSPQGVAVGPDGAVYVAEGSNNRIRRVAQAVEAPAGLDALFFAEPSGEGHLFDRTGLHLSTVALDTGVPLWTFGYDDERRLVSITDRFGGGVRIERDAGGHPTAIVSADGVVTGLGVDSQGRLVEVRYPDGAVHGFEYSEGALMTAEVAPEGNRTELRYDELGRLTEVLDAEGGHWRYGRSVGEDGGVVFEVQSAEGQHISYLDLLDPTGAYSSRITDSAGLETRFELSADGLEGRKLLGCGMALLFQYDIDERNGYRYVSRLSRKSPSGLEQVVSRKRRYVDEDDDGVPEKIVEELTADGSVGIVEDDLELGLSSVVTPEGRRLEALYDPETLLTRRLRIAGLDGIDFDYDPRGRLTSIRSGARKVGFSYDEQGKLAAFSDPAGRTTRYAYDPAGRLVRILRPDGGGVSFSYDLNGNMTALSNPLGVSHAFEYNGVDRQSGYRTPVSGAYQYVYDRDRRLTQVRFPSGRRIDRMYADGRLVQIRVPEGDIDLSYSCGGKPTALTKGTEAIDYTYDGSLVTSERLSGTVNQRLSYAYGTGFELTGFSYAGKTTDYEYDADGLLIESGPYRIERNASNGLAESVTDGAMSLTRAFNGHGELSGQDWGIGGRAIGAFQLARDDIGRIVAKTETADGETTGYEYGYDAAGRLVSVRKDGLLVEAYQYDANGRRIRETNALRGVGERDYIYSLEDHLLRAGDTVYEYDPDGFLTRKSRGDKTTTYGYSSRGELLAVALPDGRRIDYVHDPLGRRIAKKIDGAVFEKYLWQGMTRLLTVYDGQDNLLMRFEYADARMPVAMTRDGQTYYLFYDQVGSLRLVADASGDVVKRIDYDAFGNIIRDTAPLFDIPLGFAGGLYDPDTGLIRFGFRDYDPSTGRWTAKDPILFAGGDTDLYGYVLNDPVNWVDSNGLIIGTILSRIGGKIFGQTMQEAAIGGKICDSAVGVMLGLNGGIVPQKVEQSAWGLFAALEGWGAWQTLSLAILSAGSSPVFLTVGLAGLGGMEIGFLFNDIYEKISGQSLGADIYDRFSQKEKEKPCLDR